METSTLLMHLLVNFPTNISHDISMTPQEPKMPDFKVSTQFYQVENGVEWGRLGDCDDYFWTTPDERSEKYEM